MCPHEPLIQIAPMLDVTDRHFRAFVRLLTRHAQLFTEMVVDNTILYNPANLEPYLGFNENEHPIVCQLGGSDPAALASAARFVEDFGYDEININVGCPSSRVAGKGCFGAALMKRPDVVSQAVQSIRREVSLPITVKMRLGVDEHDSPSFTRSFVETVAAGGCRHFIVHARKAWLKGLSPAKNRSVPPLQYDRVYRLCSEFPDLDFSINGGVSSVNDAMQLLNGTGYECDDSPPRRRLKGVMIGRAAMNTPSILASIDTVVYGVHSNPDTAESRRTLAEGYIDYLNDLDSSVYCNKSPFQFLKPVVGLLSGQKGNRLFRSNLDTLLRDKSMKSPGSILRRCLDIIDEVVPGILDMPFSQSDEVKPIND